MYYIYKITCLANGKSYIGATNNPERRFKEHMKLKSHAIALNSAVEKYNADNFCIETIDCFLDSDDASKAEIENIKKHNTLSPNGYNLMAGTPFRKYVGGFSEETRKKMSLSRIGLKNNFGKKHTEETKKKISAALTGRKLPEYLLEKRRGRKMSEQERQKRTGKKRSEEVKKRISDSMKLHKRTQEHCENIRKSSVGHKVSDETRKKISETLKKKAGYGKK